MVTGLLERACLVLYIYKHRQTHSHTHQVYIEEVGVMAGQCLIIFNQTFFSIKYCVSINPTSRLDRKCQYCVAAGFFKNCLMIWFSNWIVALCYYKLLEMLLVTSGHFRRQGLLCWWIATSDRCLFSRLSNYRSIHLSLYVALYIEKLHQTTTG